MPRGQVESPVLCPTVPVTATCGRCSAVDAVGQVVAGGDARGLPLVVLVPVLVVRLVVVFGGAIGGNACALPWSWIGPAATTAVRCALTPVACTK